jgi:hypothetical protein
VILTAGLHALAVFFLTEFKTISGESMSTEAGKRATPPKELSEQVKALARRWCDGCYTDEGHSLTKDELRQLEDAGLVRPLGNGYHEETPLMRQSEVY